MFVEKISGLVHKFTYSPVFRAMVMLVALGFFLVVHQPARSQSLLYITGVTPPNLGNPGLGVFPNNWISVSGMTNPTIWLTPSTNQAYASVITVQQAPNPDVPGSATYSAAQGNWGNATTVAGISSGNASVTLSKQSQITFVGTTASSPGPGAGLPWMPGAAGVYASSVAGWNQANITNGGYTAQGGNSGSATVSLPGYGTTASSYTPSPVAITIGSTNYPANGVAGSPVVGIAANSMPQWVYMGQNYINDTGWPASQFIGGNAGAVTVGGSVSITGNANYAVGIAAASIGGVIAFPSGAIAVNVQNNGDKQTAGYVRAPGSSGYPSSAGNGSTSTVNLISSNIALTGINSIGVIATSAAGYVLNPPNSNKIPYAQANAGSVSVTTDAYTSIAIGLPINTTSSSLNTPLTIAQETIFANQYNAANPSSTAIARTSTSSASNSTANFAAGIIANSLGAVWNNYIAASFGDNTPTGSGNAGVSTQVVNAGSIIAYGGIVIKSSNGQSYALGNLVDLPTTAYLNTYINKYNSGTLNPGAQSITGIQILGNNSYGIVAQSIGGMSSYVNGIATACTSGCTSVGDSNVNSLGGAGGGVSVTNSGLISTAGDQSIGILAQSIGGGGGQGANSQKFAFAVGGSGGAGGNGGNINVALNSGSNIYSIGDYAYGVVAQSVGGGGGNGGGTKSYGLFISAAVGGAGGNGGNGGQVNLTSTTGTSILTLGDHANGVILQSIGGGGGTGGSANSKSLGSVLTIGVAVGGSAGNGGQGGAINSLAEGSALSNANNTNTSIFMQGGSVTNSGSIFTLGNDSLGILGQSIGGGGGVGGASTAKTYAIGFDSELPNLSVSFALGGTGGSGGQAQTVYFNNSGSITTYGGNSVGIEGQSIGGGGGHAGDATAGSNSIGTASVNVTTSMAIGGSGGSAGNGSIVGIINSGNISTYGHNSQGILAQSIGGGGGNGGFGNADELTATTSNNAYQGTISLGGSGSGGGAGSTVSVSNSGAIKTIGSSSAGIMGQSISGGGGNGGNAGAQGISGAITGSVTVGGSAGKGYAAGNVNILNTGVIATGSYLQICNVAWTSSGCSTGSKNLTLGGDARGIVAQSIGGGGGVGGSADPNANVASNLGSIAATGANNYLGGKGVIQWFGQIPNSIAKGSAIPSAPTNYNLSLAVGGKGGAGGDGGVVNVLNTGSITTIGARADGVLAQSIGGGGGVGGQAGTGSYFTASGTVSMFSGLNFNLGVNVGGTGGTTGNGGTVSVLQNSNASITTFGYQSNGILAQSIGGGGGVGHDGTDANFSGGVGSSNSANLTLGTNSTGGSASGAGGSINISGSSLLGGSITTWGDRSAGVLAQSIGGAGGLASGGCTNTFINGTTNASLCLANQNSNGTMPVVLNTGNASYALSINASASSQSTGGAVTYFSGGTGNSSNITTNGTGSIGVLLQSVGGGGGVILGSANNISSASLPSGNTGTAAGGLISANLQPGSSISTTGAGSWGMLLQSVGGGGGVLGDTSLNLTGDSNGVPLSYRNTNSTVSGNAAGGNIDAFIGGNIQTTGANAHAIVLQSVSGGGGISGSISTPGSTTSNPLLLMGQTGTVSGSISLGYSGGINLTQSAGSTISATGPGSVGILAQSANGFVFSNQTTLPSNIYAGNYGNISIYIYGNVIGNASAIMLSGGWQNNTGSATLPSNSNEIVIMPGAVVSNTAIIGTTVNGVTTYTGSGVAILQGSGTAYVQNMGTVNGSVVLGTSSATAGEFYNQGIVNLTGTSIVANNSFVNSGVVYVSARGQVGSTIINGAYKQYAGGSLYFDVDSRQPLKSDLLTINGNAIVGGKIITEAKAILPGQYSLLTATNLTTTSDLTMASGLAFNWSLSRQGNTLATTPSENLHINGLSLSDTQTEVVNYLQRAWYRSDPSLANLFGYLSQVPDTGTYQSAIQTLSGQVLNAQPMNLVMSTLASMGDSMSCPEFIGAGVYADRDGCVWGKAVGGVSNQSTVGSDITGYHSNGYGLRFGGQKQIATDWHVGTAFGVGYTTLTSSGFNGYSQAADLNVSLKRDIGNFSLSGSLGAGLAAISNNRAPDLGPLGTVASLSTGYASSTSMNVIDARLRAAYKIDVTNETYIKPFVDIDVIRSATNAYSESGSGLLGLSVGAVTQTNMVYSPMIEFGTKFNLDDKTTLKTYASVGASFLPNNSRTTTSSFVSALSDNGTFQVTSTGPSTLGRLNLGVQVYKTDAIEMRAEYALLVGNSYSNQMINAQFLYRF